jgi:DNA-binding transcriptional regulator YiaG
LIRAIRLHLQESQAEFAARFNSHANTVSRWESGTYQAPYEVLDFVIRKHGMLETITCPVCKGNGYL